MVVIRRKDFLRPKKRTQGDETENVATKSEKYKSSTQNKEASPKPPKSPTSAGEMGEMGGSPLTSVDDSKKSQNGEFITQETIEEKDGRHKVTINVYRIGEEEKVKGDKVVRRAKLKFVMSYGSVVTNCVDDCHDAISKIARATNYNVPRKAIAEKIAELEANAMEEEIPLIDYVKEKYADRLAEIEQDPIAWVMSRTKEIVSYDRLKLLTFLSLASTRMERLTGMTRIHIMLVGGSGVGKSSTVKSVLKYAGDIVIPSTRLTQNALGYLSSVDTFDGHALFIEQIDRQNANYLRELMTEEKICTVVTEKATGEDGNERLVSRQRCIEGQPAVITTSVVDDIDVDKEQIFNRMLKVYVKTDSSAEDKIWSSIMNRSKVEINPVDAMVFKAWLSTRPSHAKISEEVVNVVVQFMKKLKEFTREPLNRTVEVARNLIIVTAIMRGRTEANLEDWQFVAENFQLDLLYNGLGLSERDVEFIEVLPDTGGVKTSEAADALKFSKQYTLNVLKNLERKGVVDSTKEDGKTFTWSLTPLGRRIKALVNMDKDVIEVRDEKGDLTGVVDGKFRPDSNGTGDKGNAVPGNDGNGMSKGDGETNPVIQAYKYLKQHGWALVTDIAGWYGDDILEELKRKDMITFNNIDGVEYVNAK